MDDGKVAGLSPTLENYLEAIYFEIAEKSVARVRDIAKRAGVAMSSVNGALGRLAQKGYVRHTRYEFVELTEDGTAIAEKLARRHEMLRKFLVNILQVDPEVGEKDACEIEHRISSETMDKLIRFVSFLEQCPIKDDPSIERFHKCSFADGRIDDCSQCDKLHESNPELARKMEKELAASRKWKCRNLAELPPGTSGVVKRVRGSGPIHRRILDMGLVPGATVEVERIAPLGDPIKIKLRGYALSLRKSEAQKIEVHVDND